MAVIVEPHCGTAVAERRKTTDSGWLHGCDTEDWFGRRRTGEVFEAAVYRPGLYTNDRSASCVDFHYANALHVIRSGQLVAGFFYLDN